MSGDQLLKIEDLCTYYHTRMEPVIRAVDGVGFEIYNDEAIALVGESGCGKSTTAHAILRVLPSNAWIERGRIIYDGKVDLIEADEDILKRIRSKEISIIFQGSMNMLDPVMKTEDQIAEVMTIHDKSIGKEEAKQEARKLLEMTGIPSHRGKDYPHQLSGGQKQRVSIAIAIALNPKLIIADEPFTALDVMVQAQLIELLNDVRKKVGSSLMLITHDIHVVGELCDKILVMYAGKIFEYGNLEEVIGSPAHPYTMGLLNAVPSIDGPVTELRSIPGFPPNLANPPSGCRFHPRCPQRSELCDKEEPQLISVDRNHYVACHLLLKR